MPGRLSHSWCLQEKDEGRDEGFLMNGIFYNHQPSVPPQFGVVVSRFTFSSNLASVLGKDITGHRLFSA